MKRILFLVLNAIPLLALIILAASSAHAFTWTVTRSEWTEQDESDYSRFVEAIGLAREQGKCSTTEGCLKNAPGNFLRTSEDANLTMHVDCADLPYALRAYFAAKRGLPFAYTAEIAAAPAPVGSEVKERDIRYSTYGNLIVRRRQHVSGSIDFNRFWTRLIDSVSSGTYRNHPNPQENSLLSDMYSVDIRKGSATNLFGIRPGTVIYDPAGHVAVIYKIGSSGRMFFIDAHPDNTLTRGSYGQKFERSRPHAGAGFKNFRPLRVQGGRAVLDDNEMIPDFSTVQFYGTHPAEGQSWNRGKFILNGTELHYYDYVRAVMADGNVTIDPIVEVSEMTDGLCLDIKDRINSVRSAVKNGMHTKAHPSRLPRNIYGTSGEWEEYSTPSRDARLKTSFRELYTSVESWLQMHAQGSPRIRYSGTNLKADIRRAYDSVIANCRLKYLSAEGREVRFTVNDVAENLFKLSFSPYHCVDMRWGGIGGMSTSCTSDPDKMKWYRAQQRLRNQLERTYDTRMNYTAEELLHGEGSQIGRSSAPEVDVRKLLR